VTAAFSDYSQSFTEAIKAVYPHARFQADHFHTVKNIWGHLKKSLLSYRRQIKASGAEKKDEQLLAIAKQLWKLRCCVGGAIPNFRSTHAMRRVPELKAQRS